MSDKRKKIIGAGILVICIASMVHASNERKSPSLGWMLALSTSWGLIVWLWADKMQLGRVLISKKVFSRRKIRNRLARLRKEAFLSNSEFDRTLNLGTDVQKTGINLKRDCATNGWRKLSTKDLRQATSLVYDIINAASKERSKIERLIAKGTVSDGELTDRIKRIDPHVTDWRHLNFSKLMQLHNIALGNPDGVWGR